jgi:hypothetical protein
MISSGDFAAPVLICYMNQDPRRFRRWKITEKCVIPMLEAFKNGVEFIIPFDVMPVNTGCTFDGWCREDAKQKNLYFKVTNDERRKLIPILKQLNTDMNICYKKKIQSRYSVF